MPLSISITKGALASAMDYIVRIAESSGHGPRAGTMLLKTDQGCLTVVYSDGTVLATSSVACEIADNGCAVVDARSLGALVATMPNNRTLRLSLDQDHVLVRAGRFHFKLPARVARNVPMLEITSPEIARITLNSKRLGQLLAGVTHAMDTAQARDSLVGTYLAVEDGDLWAVATDGFQLAVSCEPVACRYPAKAEVTLPHKSVQRLQMMLATATDDVTLIIGHQDVRVIFNSGAVFCTQGLGVEFPQWQRCIPITTATIQVPAHKLRHVLMAIRTSMEPGNAWLDGERRLCRIRCSNTCIEMRYADVAFCSIAAEASLPDTIEFCVDLDALAAGIEPMCTPRATVRLQMATDRRFIVLRPLTHDYPMVVLAVLNP